MKVIKTTILYPNYVKEVVLDNNKIFRVSPIDNFEVGDEVEIFTNTYGSGFDQVKIDGIKKVVPKTIYT